MLGPEALRDLPGTLAAVRQIGFTEVELPHLMGKKATEIAAMLRDTGLDCPSMHVPLAGSGTSLADPTRIADMLGALGAHYAIVPMPPVIARPQPGEPWGTAMGWTMMALGTDGWTRIAEQLNQAGEALAPHGIRVGYHNHDLELRPLGDGGPTPLDLLLRRTNPAHVDFEMDVGWVAAAGADPVALIRQHPRRFRLLHLKDLAARSASGATLAMKPADLGEGLIDWRALRKAINLAGIRHLFVEQEPPFTVPRIDAARLAYDRLTKFNY